VVTAGSVTTRDFQFSPAPDPTPPVISNVTVTNIQDTSATITWTTDDASTSQVEYGPTRSLGSLTTEDPTLVTNHSVTLTGLTANRVYHYRVISRNASDLSSTSAKYLFFTAASYTGGGTSIIIDNVDPGFSIPLGTWSTGTSASGRYGADYRFANTVSPPPTAIARWTPSISQPGPYNVYVWYPQGTNRADNAPYTVNYNGGSTTIRVNQQTNGGQWNLIASGLQFAAGTAGNVELANDANPSVVIADAVKFEYAGPPDTTPPSVPTGLAAAATSTTQIQLSWQASTDASGIGGYKIYRNGILIDGTTGATSYLDYELLPNTSYTYSVAAYDIYGNTSELSSAVIRATLSLPLISGSITCDKPIGIWQTASNAFTFTNTIGFGAEKIDHIRYVWDRNPTHTWSNSETSWTSGTVIGNASPGGNNWYFHARSYNADNVPSGSGIDLGPYWCDTTAPETPVVAAALFSTSWIGGDPESGVAEYQYAIGTSAGGTEVRNWTSAGTSDSITASGLSLALDQKYYFSVKSRNNAQVWGAAGNSDGTTIARACESIAEAKGYANGLAVVVPGRYVTWVGGGGIAIQDPDRTAGIMVPTPGAFAVGDIVQAGGILWTSARDRLLSSPEVTKTGGPVSPKPLAMGCLSLGGADLNQWTPGIPGSIGPNNLGLLVRTWGRVTLSTPTCFYISDGSAIGGSERKVRVFSSVNPAVGKFVLVTGVSSWTVELPDFLPYILTRSPDDVQVFP